MCSNCSPGHCTNVTSTCSPKMIPFRVWLPYCALRALFLESNFKDRTTQTALDPLAGSRFVPGTLRALESCGLRWPCAVAVSEGPESDPGLVVVVSSSDSSSSSLASGVCLGDRRTARSALAPRCRLVHYYGSNLNYAHVHVHVHVHVTVAGVTFFVYGALP